MSTTIDALRNLGLKVNGTEPVSNYTGNIINEIAENYTGGGGGSGIYTFDFSAATAVEEPVEDYTFTLPINLATMQELLEQPVINLTLGGLASMLLETSHITVTKGLSDWFTGGAMLANGSIICVVFDLTSSTATLELRTQASGSGSQVYKHTLVFTLNNEPVPIAIISTNDTTITNTSTFETVMEPAITSYAIGNPSNKQPILDWNVSIPSNTSITLILSGKLTTINNLVFVSDTVTTL